MLFSEDLGTLGGGNHFAEILVAVTEQKQEKQHYYLMIHCGSRKFGQEVAKMSGNLYLNKHRDAILWARENRRCIAEKISNAIGIPIKEVVNITHNYIETDLNNNFIHRKGAVSTCKNDFDFGVAEDGSKLLIVPGSRGTLSYILKTVDNQQGHEKFNYSIAHGAGRKLKRSDCKKLFNSEFYKQRVINVKGSNETSTVCCNNESLLIQEHPEAYKDIDSVITDIVDANLAVIYMCLRPIWTFKD